MAAFAPLIMIIIYVTARIGEAIDLRKFEKKLNHNNYPTWKLTVFQKIFLKENNFQKIFLTFF